MSRFCVVNESSRLSVQFLDCPHEALRLNVPAGHVAIATSKEVGNYAYIEGELLAIGEAPSDLHRFDVQALAWVDSRAELQVSAEAWRAVRTRRDALLAATDWRVVQAMESGQPLSQAWQFYRQALRDITDQTDPHHIIWPAAPVAATHKE